MSFPYCKFANEDNKYDKTFEDEKQYNDYCMFVCCRYNEC